eukprot:TRINITY_DN2930_c0_g1_i1.p1 TRINITY_DN2930_c0_g1~~TRINITY_DN2930_c0_g1_i1.p1  ORF type:complete len:303 (+),score=77.17 TRINITY_DN2930_c0_g1_i1:916-1824(+)
MVLSSSITAGSGSGSEVLQSGHEFSDTSSGKSSYPSESVLSGTGTSFDYPNNHEEIETLRNEVTRLQADVQRLQVQMLRNHPVFAQSTPAAAAATDLASTIAASFAAASDSDSEEDEQSLINKKGDSASSSPPSSPPLEDSPVKSKDSSSPWTLNNNQSPTPPQVPAPIPPINFGLGRGPAQPQGGQDVDMLENRIALLEDSLVRLRDEFSDFAAASFERESMLHAQLSSLLAQLSRRAQTTPTSSAGSPPTISHVPSVPPRSNSISTLINPVVVVSPSSSSSSSVLCDQRLSPFSVSPRNE